MKILIVKTSSLGDIIQTFPALTDAGKVISDIRFDWVVEEAFQDIPKMHPLVHEVIPIAIRRWKKHPFQFLFSNEWKNFRRKIKFKKYDLIIDAQGLIKSGLITRMAIGEKVGLDKKSLTESFARFFYDRYISIDLQKHAVFRMRSIFAEALHYSFDAENIEYGIFTNADTKYSEKHYVLFLHGTTWPSKHWPDRYWIELAKLIENDAVLIPWSNEVEKNRAQMIAEHAKNVVILPKMTLKSLSSVISGAKYCACVDSGLAHLSAALNTPAIVLYGPTNPKRIGTAGSHQIHLQSGFSCQCCDKKICRFATFSSKCLEAISPETVFAYCNGNFCN